MPITYFMGSTIERSGIINDEDEEEQEKQGHQDPEGDCLGYVKIENDRPEADDAEEYQPGNHHA